MKGAPLLQLTSAVARPGGPGTPVVLNGCSLSLWPKESVALIGESGVGKTTLLRVLAGMLPLEDGRLRAPIRIGWLSQHPATAFDPRWSVIRSVAEPARLAGRSKIEAFDMAQKVMQTLKLSRVQWDLRPMALSGGQLRRAAIARALVSDPQLVVADEPTAGLDPEIALALINLLRERIKARGATLLYATHDLGVAAHLSDRVVVMDDGKIVEVASMYRLALQARSPAARRLLGSWLPLDPAEARKQLAKPGSVQANPETWPSDTDEDEEE
jgi:peptide/nickel transport system ATP-binding protein